MALRDPEGEHVRRLTAVFLGAFDRSEVATLLKTGLNINPDAVLGSGNLTDVLGEVFSWTGRRGLWVKLLEAARAERSEKEAFVLVVDEVLDYVRAPHALVAVGGAAVKPPYEDRILYNRKPFLDREELRLVCRNLADPHGLRVFCLRHSTAVGKSYFTELLRHVAVRTPRKPLFAVVELTQPNAQPAELSAQEVAEQIRYDWNESRPLPTRAAGVDSTVRWGRHLAKFLMERFTDDRPVWLTFDRFAPGHENRPADDVADLIEELARIAVNPNRELRLVLLGYNRPFTDNSVAQAAHTHTLQPISSAVLIEQVNEFVLSHANGGAQQQQAQTILEELAKSNPGDGAYELLLRIGIPDLFKAIIP